MVIVTSDLHGCDLDLVVHVLSLFVIVVVGDPLSHGLDFSSFLFLDCSY